MGKSEKVKGRLTECVDQDKIHGKGKKKGNGVYAMVVEGSVTIDGQILNKRDALGIWDTESIKIKANSDFEILLLDVPMEV